MATRFLWFYQSLLTLLYVSCIRNLLYFKQKQTPKCWVSDCDSYNVSAMNVCQACWRHTRRQTLGICSTNNLNKRSEPDWATDLKICTNILVILNCETWGCFARATVQGNSDVIDWCVRTVADRTADSTDEYRPWIFINNHVTPRLSWKKICFHKYTDGLCLYVRSKLHQMQSHCVNCTHLLCYIFVLNKGRQKYSQW